MGGKVKRTRRQKQRRRQEGGAFRVHPLFLLAGAYACFNRSLPLYLGANDENMANGAAVLGQTSVPIGGINTNAVIAGHRGWNGYPYFLNLDELQIGDIVYIDNIWTLMKYEVVDIQVISPDDVDAIKIQDGRDLVTLLTCHPPNTGGRQRLLVFCERASE